MERTTSFTPLLMHYHSDDEEGSYGSSALSTPLHSDNYLSVEDVETSLNNRKVEVISRNDLCMESAAGVGIGLILGIMATFIAVTLTLPFTIVLCDDGETMNANCALLGFLYIPVAFGVFVCTCVASVCSAINFFRYLDRKGKLNKNQELEEISHNLCYSDSSKERLTPSDFIELYRQDFLSPDLIQELSFEQIQAIKEKCKDLKEEGNSIQKFIHENLTPSQSGPWNKLKMVSCAEPESLSMMFREDYVKTHIESTQGFFEELLLLIPKEVIHNSEFTISFLNANRHYLQKRFSYTFTDEEILAALEAILNGAPIERSFLLSKSHGTLFTIECGTKKMAFPKTVLTLHSEYFDSMFRFNPSIEKVQFDDLSIELFDLFIQYIQGLNEAVSPKNVDQFIEIAHFFSIEKLVMACETPLILRYEDAPIETKLEILERYPLIKGRFRKHVDSEYAIHISSFSIDAIIEHFEKAKELELNQTVQRVKEIFLKTVEAWCEDESQAASFPKFIEQVKCFEKYFLDIEEAIPKKIQEAIITRLGKNPSEIKELYKLIRTNPTLLLAASLLSFMRNPEYQEHVHGLFLAIKPVIEQLEKLLSKLSADQKLLSEIQEWKATHCILVTFDEFISQIKKFNAEIQTEQFKSPIQEKLIETICYRMTDTENSIEEKKILFERFSDAPLFSEACVKL